MTQPSHALEISTLDLLGSRLRHIRCRRPVVLPSQEIDGAFLVVNLTDAIARVKPTEVEVEIAMENSYVIVRARAETKYLGMRPGSSPYAWPEYKCQIRSLLTAGLLGAIIP